MSSTVTTFKPEFGLFNYLQNVAGPRAKTILGGSATAYLSIKDLIQLSTEPEKTRQRLETDLFSQPLVFGSDRGSPDLRETIASTYATAANISADNILVTNATTGANHIVERSVLTAGDHVIIQYPIYGPSVEEPLAIGCDVSFLRADASNEWRVDPAQLRALIRPGKTKLILLTNPGNPTGSFIDRETQREIISIAREHDLVIHCDEIFRPFFHSPDLQGDQAPSFAEHADLNYDKVVVTSSLSKCYGLSGIRIGWITTRSSSLYEIFQSYRMFSISALSTLDEIVATEALSPRCRPAILSKHLGIAQVNLDLIDAFAESHKGLVDWSRPKAGAVGFMRLIDPKTGLPRDDVDFCDRLLNSKGVLLSPGTPCFEFHLEGQDDATDFKGRVRIHFTLPTAVLQTGLQGLAEFLAER